MRSASSASAAPSCPTQAIVARHGGEVPHDHDALIRLPGASHKTANLVLGIAFGIASGIVVDTHVAGVTERLGVVSDGRPEAIEAKLHLMLFVKVRENWGDAPERYREIGLEFPND